jgi:hypothetical protein
MMIVTGILGAFKRESSLDFTHFSVAVKGGSGAQRRNPPAAGAHEGLTTGLYKFGADEEKAAPGLAWRAPRQPQK